MGRMIPDYVHQDCQSAAERKLFFRFRDELSDDYIVLHSLALAQHQKKLRSEIDFVVLSKRGMLSIEVKGGRIDYENGIWTFQDRYGDIHTKRESPFEQASSAMYALKRSIDKEFWGKSYTATMIIGYAVIFPDICFNRESPEWDCNRIIDINKIHQKLSGIIKQQYDYSESELRRTRNGYTCHQLSGSELTSLVKFLRGDFHFIPSLNTAIDSSYQNLLRLTEEQYEILDQFEGNPRIIMHGRAGTGKTVLALEKARRSARAGKKVFYVCFNRLLARKIETLIESENLSSQIQVSTLHGYARKIIKTAGFETLIENAENSSVYRTKYPELFEEAFVTIYKDPPFDTLVVDEGQDLRFKAYLRMLDWTLKGGMADGEWLWAEDSQQNLFNIEQESCDVDLNQFRPFFCKLTKNCRNTLPISIFTSLAAGLDIQKCLIDEGPKVETRFYRDQNHELIELNRIVQYLLSNGINSGDIIILTPVITEKSVLKNIDKLAEIPLRNYDVFSPHKRFILHTTIHSYKGLEAKVIIVTDLENLYEENYRYLNYVGFSRAMSWLGVLINEKAKPQYDKLAREFGKKLAEFSREL